MARFVRMEVHVSLTWKACLHVQQVPHQLSMIASVPETLQEMIVKVSHRAYSVDRKDNM